MILWAIEVRYGRRRWLFHGTHSAPVLHRTRAQTERAIRWDGATRAEGYVLTPVKMELRRAK